uniref:Uncharacterized protein n=1 Tax=Dulem virus 61 TaxID=3145772 RepID=A0AAU8BBJ8_9VIRU
MSISDEINQLIERASEVAGSQKKLAEIMGIDSPSLTQMKRGKRPANWRVRGKLRAILGEDPARAFMSTMAEELGQSENEDEKKAALALRAALDAFPIDGGVWRRR